MSWKYTMLSNTAIRIETGEKFGIKFDRNLSFITDFELVPPSGSEKKWSSTELNALKDELWSVMEEEFEQSSLRNKLLSLINSQLFGENYRAADIISRISGKKVSERSIQAWLIESDKRSSRKCPVWAVTALETYLTAPENQELLRASAESYKILALDRSDRSWEVMDKHAVKFAQGHIDADKKRREEWQQANLTELPTMLFEMENNIVGEIDYLSETLSTMLNVIFNEGNDLDEIRRKLKSELEGWSLSRSCVQKTRRAIEGGTDEFSNDQGILP